MVDCVLSGDMDKSELVFVQESAASLGWGVIFFEMLSNRLEAVKKPGRLELNLTGGCPKSLVATRIVAAFERKSIFPKGNAKMVASSSLQK